MARSDMAQAYAPHQLRLYGHDLSARRGEEDVDRLTLALMDAAIDLHPHQVEAALFALRSPFGGGTVLADETGLGKTIEAGLVLAQDWAEGRRRFLVICPASLRRQWLEELEEKFGLPGMVLDGWLLDGLSDREGVVVTSFALAARVAETLREASWDRIVVDEAHAFRHLYRDGSKTGRAVLDILADRPRLLLTALPIQNSLLELYSFGMLADGHLFGHEAAFRENYREAGGSDLKSRMATFVKRTLRRDVSEYIRYTKREALTVVYRPTEAERALAARLSSFAARLDEAERLAGRRRGWTVAMGKAWSSSRTVVAGKLRSLRARWREEDIESASPIPEAVDPYEGITEAEEEESNGLPAPETRTVVDVAEMDEIDALIALCEAEAADAPESKADKFLEALEEGFARMRAVGTPEKALVFTESRLTQRFLTERLERVPAFAGRVVNFHGGLDAEHRRRAVDDFRRDAAVMVATDAAAEGLNLQCCALVVNYDLPWNPQRVEQRIGRAHRYGQRHDVVVVNFLDETNEIDRRVYRLLRERFKLFDGMFGASDEILGRLEDGAVLEERLREAFAACRTRREIDEAFARVQRELAAPIEEKMRAAREALFEHFDEDVHRWFRIGREAAGARRDEALEQFWRVTRALLTRTDDDRPYYFDDERRRFGTLREEIERGYVPDGVNVSFAFQLGGGAADDADTRWATRTQRRAARLRPRPFGPSTPLGARMLAAAKALDTPSAHLVFDYGAYPYKITRLEGRPSGRMIVGVVEAAGHPGQDRLVRVAAAYDGAPFAAEDVHRLFRLPGRVAGPMRGTAPWTTLESAYREAVAAVERDWASRSERWLTAETEKLDRWAAERRQGLYHVVKDKEAAVKAARKTAADAGSMNERLAGERRVRALRAEVTEARKAYEAAVAEVDKEHKRLLAAARRKAQVRLTARELFRIGFSIE